MADFFKSALGGIISGVQGGEGNDFVGQFVELGNQKLRVKRLIAEGGFGFVFVAQDVSSGKEYALKRLLVHEENKDAVLLEIKYLKKLSGHPHIIQFISAAGISKDKSDHGQAEYLLLSELCTGGLVDELDRQGKPLPFDQVLRIFHQSCLAVQHMHKQIPVIVHRDLKAENLLISAQGSIKLCDFGSATTDAHFPDTSWTALQRSLVEEEITKNTTPMYRAPEMLDLYQNFEINQACDIWALGCLLFKLCFYVHPFEDSAKLRIINANYVIPDGDLEYTPFHDLIRATLKCDPVERLGINELINRLQQIAQNSGINLKEPLSFPNMSFTSLPDTPERRAPQGQQPPSQGGVPAEGPGFGSMFSSLKGGAGNMFKTIKDASSKAMETVSNTIYKTDMDISYITTRIIVMSYPAEGMESAIKNNIDDVRTFLEQRHHGSYAVYNLSQRSYRAEKFENRVSECGWAGSKKAPPLTNLYAICKNMHLWLRQKPKNICVVHCLDGKANSATVLGAFLVFCRLFENPSAAMHLFTARRSQPAITPSQKRYIDYISQMVQDKPVVPHTGPVLLKSLTLKPPPFFNKNQNGCTPFVEVYIGEDRVLTTSQEYEKMRQVNSKDGQAVIPLNTQVSGDVTVMVYHARSTFGGKMSGKITSMKMLQFQFHTGFVSQGSTSLQFHHYELDQLDTSDKYPDSFTVTLDLMVSNCTKQAAPRKQPWDGFPVDKLSPKILFSSKDEIQQTFSEFGVSDRAKSRLARASSFDTESPKHAPSTPAKKENQEERTVGNSSFFSTLEWQDEKTAQNEATQNAEPTETKIGLLDDDSDEEDGFCSLRPSGGSDIPAGYGQLIDGGDNNVGGQDEVDLLNMNSAKTNSSVKEASEQLDFLNIGGDPTNVDLLSGHKSSQPAPDLLGMSDDSFDPFQQLSSERAPSPAKPDLMTSNTPSKPNDTFDPFSNFGSSSSSSAAQPSSNSSQPKADTFDPFSNFGGAPAPSTAPSNSQQSSGSSQQKPETFDPFSNLGGGPSAAPQDEFLAFMEGPSSGAPSTTKQEPDLMGGWGAGNVQMDSLSTPGVMPKSASTGQNMNFQGMMGAQSSSQGNMAAMMGQVPKADPFGDLGNVGKAPFKNTGPMNQPRPAGQQPGGWGSPQRQAPMQGAPMQGGQGGQGPMGGAYQPRPMAQQPSQPSQPSQPTNPSPQHKPQGNYSSVIGGRTDRGTHQTVGPKPKVTANSFGDLLGEHQFTSAKKDEGPKTIADMRKDQMVQEMDPDKLRLMEWTAGKENNIRALICSLDKVLWDSETRWKPINISKLVQPSDVKKWYRKAILSVHPDKLQPDDPNKEFAKLVFMELNDSWEKFEEEGSKALY